MGCCSCPLCCVKYRQLCSTLGSGHCTNLLSCLLNEGHRPLIIRISFNANVESRPMKCHAGASPAPLGGTCGARARDACQSPLSLAPTDWHHATGSPHGWAPRAGSTQLQVGAVWLLSLGCRGGSPAPSWALSTGRDPGKGLLLMRAQGLSWGRGPSNLPGRSRGAPSLPRAARGQGFSRAAGSPEQLAGEDAGSTGCRDECFPVMSTDITQPNPLPYPSPWGPHPRQPPHTEPSSPVPARGWTGGAGGSHRSAPLQHQQPRRWGAAKQGNLMVPE